MPHAKRPLSLIHILLKSAFIKAIENKDAGLDLKSVCYLKWKGFPDSFIEFLGGLNLD